MNTVARPSWGPRSPWAAQQLSAMTLRWLRGGLAACDHRQPGGDPDSFTYLSPAIAAAVCDGPCASLLSLRLVARLARAVPCDGCGRLGAFRPAFVGTLNPLRTLVVALCGTCLANGPRRPATARSLTWAAGSAWVAKRTHAELLAWAQNRLFTCPHRRTNRLAVEATVFDVATSTVRCPGCQNDAPSGQRGPELCAGCSAAEALMTAALSHTGSPEYTLLVPLCGRCVQNGPESAQ